MKHASALSPLALLAACATYADAPIVDNGTALPEGSLAALRQPVALHDIVLTPMKVVEDSRCPINTRCVWAGRIIVETRFDGLGWRETVPLTLGEPEQVRGYIVNLVTAEPGRTADEDTKSSEYRFGFEGWPPGHPPD